MRTADPSADGRRSASAGAYRLAAGGGDTLFETRFTLLSRRCCAVVYRRRNGREIHSERNVAACRVGTALQCARQPEPGDPAARCGRPREGRPEIWRRVAVVGGPE